MITHADPAGTKATTVPWANRQRHNLRSARGRRGGPAVPSCILRVSLWCAASRRRGSGGSAVVAAHRGVSGLVAARGHEGRSLQAVWAVVASVTGAPRCLLVCVCVCVCGCVGGWGAHAQCAIFTQCVLACIVACQWSCLKLPGSLTCSFARARPDRSEPPCLGAPVVRRTGSGTAKEWGRGVE